MKAVISNKGMTVTVEVAKDSFETIENLVQAAYHGMIAMGYAPQTVASAMWEHGNEMVEFFYPDED